MKSTRLPLLLVALSATAIPSLAQQVASHTYTTVDAYGNVKTETVRTPLADAPSPAAMIAQQGVLGPNTTSSTFQYGHTYPPIDSGYCPPTYPVGGPIYGTPYPYPYPYPVINNNYFPQQPYNMQIGPLRNGQAPWVTSIPLGTTYIGGVPYCPPYGGGTYYNGVGRGGITTTTKINAGKISVGKGGISGSYSSVNRGISTVDRGISTVDRGVSTVILPGHSSYITSNESQRYRR